MELVEIVEVLSRLATAVGVLGAGWWFVYAAKIAPRIQFDLNCNFFCANRTHGKRVVEIQLIFRNKGYVEHRMYDVTLSVHGLASAKSKKSNVSSQNLLFPLDILNKTPILPHDINYYFVRPGVEQVITHVIEIDDSVEIIRVTAGFYYDEKTIRRTPHTARRVFSTNA